MNEQWMLNLLRFIPLICSDISNGKIKISIRYPKKCLYQKKEKKRERKREGERDTYGYYEMISDKSTSILDE